MRLWYQTSQTLGKLNIYDFRTIFIINLGYFRIKASEFLGYFMTSFLTLEHFTTFQKQKNKKRNIFETLSKNKYQYSE